MLVDDEPPARRSLIRLLSEYADVEVVAEADSIAAAARALPAARPDILFLDIELTDGKGFDLLAGIEHRPTVVFVTAYSSYAVRAFDVEATDFLLKPVEPERLALTIDRLRRKRQPSPATSLPPGIATITVDRTFAGRILLSRPGHSVFAPTEELVTLRAEGDYTRVGLLDGRDVLVCRLLGQFETDLPTPPFYRLSRSIMVNLARVRRVAWSSGGRAELHFDGTAVPVLAIGRAAARRLRGGCRVGAGDPIERRAI
ncbi:LytR/AlgR family response regulator transcription factor [Chelatococcus reniformis]|uniref:DNA-binding response regulator n=1 Tax=Chelatococcus reniformis TaxID=1494448 RepID=A0A916U8V2_9HYPH|nr:LytTR family DNA-binding domain-containing protein [Chelatococcus reniformis]GGC64856.1 DNA-binding response regulator [Chelatococcus reniformis]